MLTKEQAREITQKALSFSSFPQCDIGIYSVEKSSIRFALNGITTSGFTTEQWMSISSERDGRSGSANLTEFDDKSLRDAVKLTEKLALISLPNPESTEPLKPQKYPAIENFVESTAKARNEVMIPQVRAIITAAKAKDLVAAGFFERSAGAAAVANKQGNFAYGRTTDANLSTTIRSADGSSSGWASQPAVRIEQIDGATVGKTAIEKCLRWKNPRRLEPGRYTVVLEPTAVADLVERIGFSLQARAADEGRSFLSKKGGGTLVGEKLFPESITLRTDPFSSLYSALPWGGGDRALEMSGGASVGGASRPGGRRSEAEAFPIVPISWFEKGVVKNMVYNGYWARKTGKPATAGPSHLVLEGGDQSLSDLISSVDRGLLVTRFWYIRVVNPQTVQQTGLTRDGVFLIEKGKITSPVVNFRFNESPVRLLQNTVALGKPMRVRGAEGDGMIAPPLVAKDFNFSSVSDAV